MRVFDAIINEPWAIQQEALETILDIADRQIRGADLDEIRAIYAERIQAVEAVGGTPMEGTARVTVRDGIAVVPVIGPIFRRANLFTSVSGATAIDSLAKDFTAAFNAPEISGVLLAVDSPGGTVNGTNELAKMIRSAADQGTKPVLAHVSGSATSGALWIASAVHRITVDETALVGSIGVVMAGTDTRERDRARGIKDVQIVSSQSPNKRPDPATDEGVATLQARVDKLAQVFIEAIAVNRGVSAETVANDFGQGDVLVGAEAVGVGMVDAVGTQEGTISGMIAGDFEAFARADAAIDRKESEAMDINTTAELATAFPQLVTQIRDEARAEGQKEGAEQADATRPALSVESVKAESPDVAAALAAEGSQAERDRIADLEANALPGFEAVLEECKADGKSTSADLAMKIVALQKQQGSDAADKAKADADALDKVLPAPGASADGNQDPQGGDQGGDSEAALKAKWDADESLRADFHDNFAAYQRFCADDADGRIRRYAGNQA